MGLAKSHRAAALALVILAGCASEPQDPATVPEPTTREGLTDSVLDLFAVFEDPNVTLEVNRYIWTATIEVLGFMPLTSADPFSGLLIFDYGTPPGGRTAYRATVHVKDPSLDARSLNLALVTRSGSAAPDTVRAVEDAILTRARQLRVAEDAL